MPKRKKDEDPVRWELVESTVEIEGLIDAWEADRFPGLLTIRYVGSDKKEHTLFVYRRTVWHSYLQVLDWWNFCDKLRRRRK